MSALALSVLLSVVSALAYAGGAIVQEQVAVSSPDSGVLPLRRPGWWGALALNGLGGALHVVALAYGPLSLVQPLGALTIVFALPLAALCVGRRAGATAWRGALMATVGLAGLLSLVGSSSAHSLAPAQRLAVALVTGGAVVALMFAGLAAHRHPAVRSVLLATASGIAFGMSSVFTKTVAVDWRDGIALGDLPSLTVIVLFAVAGVLLSQASYRGGGLAAPLATLTVVNPVLAAAVGILMFGETFRYGTTGTALALGCGVVAAGGLIMLTTERLTRETAAAVPPGEPASVVPAPAGPFAPGVPGAEQPRLTVPQPREGGSAGTERGGRAATGTGAAEPGRPGVSAFPAGPGEPLRVSGAAAPVRAGAGEPAGRTGPTGAAAGTEAGVRAGAAETVVRAAAGVRAEEAEPVTPAGAGPAERVVRTGPAEAVVRAEPTGTAVLAMAAEPVTRSGTGEPALHATTAGPAGRPGPSRPVVPADPVEVMAYAEPVEAIAGPAGRPGPARRVVRTEPDEALVGAEPTEAVLAGSAGPGVPGSPASGPPGSDGAVDTGGAGPVGGGVLPASYPPLPAGVAVPLPVPALHRTGVRS